MSSSRRSSRSTKSLRNPVWRSTPITKKSVPASVSIIFAEPEQGTPLPSVSAIVKLPPYRTTPLTEEVSSTVPIDQTSAPMPSTSTPQPSFTSSPASHSNNDRQKNIGDIPGPSNAQTRNGSIGSTGFLGDDVDGTTTAGVPVGSLGKRDLAPQQSYVVQDTQVKSQPPSESNTTSLTTSVPFPPSGPELSSTLESPPGRSSWFGSLSRAKGKGKVAKLNQLQEGDAKDDQKAVSYQGNVDRDAVPPLSIDVQPPTPQHHQPPATAMQQNKYSEPPRSLPQPIPATVDGQEPKRGWFSSNPPLPARSSVSPITPSPLNSSHASVTSSVDDEVPALSTVTGQNPTAPAVVHNPNTDEGSSRTRLSSLSSLNPSTSRFTLSIPLLGRAKIPLDQAVAVATANRDTTVDLGSEQANQAMGVAPTQTPTHVTSPLHQESALLAETNVISCETREGVTSSSSWWYYVGLGSTGPAPNGSSPNSMTSSETDTLTVKPSHLLPSSADGEAQILEPINSNSSTNLDAGSDLDAEKQRYNSASATDHPNRASSVRSTETSQSQASAWYSPWTWYSGTSSTSLPAGIEAGSSGSPTTSKTQSELVKEEALTTESPPLRHTDINLQSTLSLSSSQEVLNPIESTIVTNRSGWTSFFSSKTLTVKGLTSEETTQKENKMEVMDLDEEDGDQRPVTTKGNGKGKAGLAPPTAVAEPSKGKDQVKQTMVPHPQPPLRKSKDTPQASPSAKAETTPTKPTAPPLVVADSVKRESVKSKPPDGKQKAISLPPSKKSGSVTPGPRTPLPNLVLPTWLDTFHAPPRNTMPPPTSKFAKTMQFVSGVLFARDDSDGLGKGKARERDFLHFGKSLPRAWDVVGSKLDPDMLSGCTRVVVIGIHGWFPGAVMRTVLGEPTGTSEKFVNMMVQALDEFQAKHNVKLKKVTTIPLEGDGTINRRVEKLYASVVSNSEWLDDLHAADAIFVATHSQGSVVSTHLLDRLIRDKHIRTSRNAEAVGFVDPFSTSDINATPMLKPQKICCLALCGIHLGPLRYLSSSSLLQPYIQFFESTAARELFEFQNTESQASEAYVKALRNVVDNGTKMVYVASLNDQVVPIYSGLFTCASHPLILRALYIDGDAYHSSDFLSNLLVLLLRVLNSGISDSGLVAHLSEATAGSLIGVGHSAAYEEIATYSLAVNYLFLTNDGQEKHPDLVLEPFNANSEQNDYEIPWALRDLIADERVVHFFSREIVALRDAFRDWHPKTSILRDIKRKLQPIQRLPHSVISNSVSKL